jgi:uncharacterized protein YfbU (UPF0304 family)
MKPYGLEIYLPGNDGDDAACTLESDQPFAPFQKGDLINPRSWPGHAHDAVRATAGHFPHGALLRVTGIEHFIVHTDKGLVQHKIGVFTEAVDDTAKNRPDGGASLSKTERWILSNQYLILEKLYPDEAKWYAERREAIESGYELHYQGGAEHISDPMPVHECKEVLDILTMFSTIQSSMEELTDKSGIDEHWSQFPGFDGNNESRQLAYAHYFCGHDGGRFKDLDGQIINSHFPGLAKLRAMLSEWRKIEHHRNMTKDDLVRITNAKPAAD